MNIIHKFPCIVVSVCDSTQGTTKEGDKDYIVRASLSPDLDLELHKKVFLDFVKSM